MTGTISTFAVILTRRFLFSAFVLPLSATVALSQEERVADLDAYCRSVHGQNAFRTQDNRDGGFLCTIRTNNGLGLLHYKLNPADACVLQHKTAAFQRRGDEIVCAVGAQSASTEVDLLKHCRELYGPDTQVTRRNADGAAMCTQRTYGGLGLLHHVIDTAALCPAGQVPGPVAGNNLTCTTGVAQSNAEPPSPAGPETRVPIEDAPEPEPVGTSPVEPDSDWEKAASEEWEFAGALKSNFPHVNIRIERRGNRFRGVIDRFEGFPADGDIPSDETFMAALRQLSDVQQRAYLLFEFLHGMHRPGRVFLEGTISGSSFEGRTRMLIQADALSSYCDDYWEAFRELPTSRWIPVQGSFSADKIVFKGTWYVFFLAYPPSCTSQVLAAPGGTQLQFDVEIVREIQVVSLEFVEADRPFDEVESVEPGQRLRIKILVDRDAQGHKVEATAGSGNNRITLTAICGSEFDSNPRVCLTDPFEIADRE